MKSLTVVQTHYIALFHHVLYGQLNPIKNTSLLRDTEQLVVKALYQNQSIALQQTSSEILSARASLQRLMDIADGEVPGKLILAGLIALYDKWITVPDDHEHFMPLQLAHRCLPLLSHARIDGIKYGTGATHLPPMPRVRTGTLIVWLRTNRNRHMIQQVQPVKGTSLRNLLGST